MRLRLHGAAFRRSIGIALAAVALTIGGPAVGMTATAHADITDCSSNSDEACGGGDNQNLGPEDPGPIEGRGKPSPDGSPQVWATQYPQIGEYIGYAQVQVKGKDFTPNGWVWTGVQDTETGQWLGGTVQADQYGKLGMSGDVVTQSFPTSSCGHTMRAAATDLSQGVNAVQTGPGQTFPLYCGPTLMVGSDRSVYGDHYTPGGYVEVNVWFGYQLAYEYYTYADGDGVIRYSIPTDVHDSSCDSVQVVSYDFGTGRSSREVTVPWHYCPPAP